MSAPVRSDPAPLPYGSNPAPPPCRSDVPPLPYRRDPVCPFAPDPEFARLRREEPVSRIRLTGGSEAWLVTRYADARQVLADPRFSSRLTPIGVVVPPSEDQGLSAALQSRQPGTFIEEDPPEHTRLRALVTREFTTRRMRLLRPYVETVVEEHLATMATAAHPVDLMAAFALPVPSRIICAILGLPEGNTYDFAGYTRVMTDVMSPLPELIEARDALRAGMREVVRGKRRDPGDDLLGRVIRDSGASVTDEELVGIGNLLLVAGHETTAHMLGLGVLALLHHPDQADVLRDRPELCDSAIDELVRYVTIPHHGELRTATEDVRVGDVLLRAGEQVLVSLPSANWDPDGIEAPDVLDLTRPPRPHLAYGHGVHHCVGTPLAQLELRVALPALLRRFPGMRCAVPYGEVPFRRSNVTYGLHALPLTW
ncbi:cytochrome P450 [Streptomyces sp. NPDC004267]|uniref:cytochrome P450 n=1 Tax=Streptomyces sp. NPDC004267 TaxID=3364694 RepID=UPI00369A7F16